MTRRLARGLIRLSAWLAPGWLRDRWREEWLAELDAAATGHLARAAGAPWDAAASRWTARPHDASSRWWSGWMSDLRQTRRSLVRSPAHVVLVVTCLGIGLAAAIAIFSIVNSLLYGEQAGIRDRRTMVRVYLGHDLAQGRESIGRGGSVAADPLSRSDLEILSEHGPAVSGVAGEGRLGMAVVVDGNPSGVVGAFVSDDYFSVLGTEPQMGRLLSAADNRPDAPPVAVVGDYFWRTSLAARPDVVGQPLDVGGRQVMIVGVAPAQFTGIQAVEVGESLANALQLWLPLSLAGSWRGVPEADSAWLTGIARLAPNATRSDADTQFQIAAHRIEAAYPGTRPNARIILRPHGFGPNDAPADVLFIVALFLSVPLSVLAIGCANVANLQVARGTDRARELSVRLSLGATRWQVIRLLTLESVMLAAVAAALGGAGAVVALRLSASFFPLAIPFDWRVTTFALVVAGAVTIVTGVAPAWLVLRRAIASGLGHSARIGGPAHARLRSGLVMLQVALSLVLLFMGALFTRSISTLNGNISDLARHLVITELDLRQSSGHSAADSRRLVSELAVRAGADSRIAAGGFADFLPSGGDVMFTRPDSPDRRERVNGGQVTPGWFDVMRARVLAGRLLTAADSGTPVAVVNATLAGRLASSAGDAVGKMIALVPAPARREPPTPVQIVGVIADPLEYPDRRHEPALYRPMPLDPPTGLVFLMHAADPAAATADLRTMLRSIDPQLPWTRSDTVAARITREISPLRYLAMSVGAFGVLALVLALTGLYAVLAYVVSLRRREIGVRVAIGAGPRDVTGLVVAHSVRLVAAGGLIGLLLVLPLAFSLRVALFGISPVEPWAVLPTLAALGLVAVLAAVVPARRATRIDPVRALRDD